MKMKNDDGLSVDLNPASELLHGGMKLVRLLSYSKQPQGEGWNKPESVVSAIDPKATGYGIPLEANGLCSVDADNYPLAKIGMQALGFDLDEILNAGVRTLSTRPGSGGRSTFRAEGDISWLKFGGKSCGTILELRASSPNLQDCVPGLLYEDKTGVVRSQSYANGKTMLDAGELPDDLYNFWLECSTDVEKLNAAQDKFYAAIEKVTGKPIGGNKSISTGKGGGKLAFTVPGITSRFNAENRVEDLLTATGKYWLDPKTKRWTHEGSEGKAGIRPIPGKDDLWQSDHGSDPLCGTFDAWSVHVLYNHGGDVKKAVAAWGKGKQQEHAEEPAGAPKSDFDPDPANPFSEWAVPKFPMSCVPSCIKDYAESMSAGSGFDAGGYAICTLVGLSSLIDQRARMAITPSYKVPPMIWLGIVSESGGGKSPVIDAGMKFASAVNSDMVRASAKAKESWAAANKGKKAAEQDPLPQWHQLIVHDTTVEALVDIVNSNPSGVILCSDELTRWIGQMDYYATQGGGRDRAYWLEAYEGREISMNRRSSGNTYVKNWSASVIGGIQPGKLTEAYKSSGGGGSDGLYQRFNLYCLQPSGEMNLHAVHNNGAEKFLHKLAGRINDWSKRGLIEKSNPALSEESVLHLQKYGNLMREIQKTTSNPRLSEHLGKYMGFLGRLSFVLHVIECAEADNWTHEVTIETVRRAEKILHCLFRHADEAYKLMEKTFNGSTLMQDIANTILAKGYEKFTHGDLMRDCNGWRKSDSRGYNPALVKLEEMGWIVDVTDAFRTGPGRPSMGRYLVNPNVHTKFLTEAQQSAEMRSRRFAAIKELGLERSGKQATNWEK